MASEKKCRHADARTVTLEITKEGDVSMRVVCGNFHGGRGCGKIIGPPFDDIGNADVGRFKTITIGRRRFRVGIAEMA